MKSLPKSRIAIAGGGIGGLTLALALREFGFEAEVYEQAPALLDVGAAIALWPNATRVLERLGLGRMIREHAGAMEEIRWLDRRGFLINRVRISDAVALHRADPHRRSGSRPVLDGSDNGRQYCTACAAGHRLRDDTADTEIS